MEILSYQFFPFYFLKAHTHSVPADEQRPLHQHPVRGQKLQLLFLRHVGKPVLQVHGLVQKSAGVKEPLQRQPALLIPGLQLFLCRILLPDIPVFKINLMLLQPLLCFFSGGAFGIFQK